jgi:hypothetical protein
MQGGKPRQTAEQGIDESSMSLRLTKDSVLGYNIKQSQRDSHNQIAESRGTVLAEKSMYN